MSRARTAEEFDEWYKNNNGDPWGYDSKESREKIYKHFLSIKKFLPQSYSGYFIELGGFNGDLTKYLLDYYLLSKVYFNDISTIAIDNTKKRLVNYKNIEYISCDLLEIYDKVNIEEDIEKTILIFESLYYLDEEERGTAVEKITLWNPEYIFISAPIWGKEYFTENDLLNLFSNKYIVKDINVLNLKPYNNIFIRALKKFFRGTMLFLSNQSTLFRKLFAGQTLYVFKIKDKNDNTN